MPTPPQLPESVSEMLMHFHDAEGGIVVFREDMDEFETMLARAIQAQRKELERENLQLRFLLSEIIDGLDRDVSVEKDIRDAKKFLGELEERKLLESLPTTRGEVEA